MKEDARRSRANEHVVARPVVLVNAAAGGGGRELEEKVRSGLASAGVEAELRVIVPSALRRAVASLAAGGAKLVCVAGGDGSVSTAAAELAGGDTALGVLPAGTLNHFARRLELEGIEAACEAIGRGKVVRVPVGEVNGRVFINNASCGMYPHMLRHRERWRRWMGKWPAAAVSWVVVSARLPLLDVRVDVPGARLSRRTPILWVGIGRGSFRLPEPGRTAREEEELEIVIAWAETTGALARLTARSLWRLLRGRTPTDIHDLETVHAPAFRLESRRPVEIALDGEPMRMDSPLEFRLVRDALPVIVP